jgi:hypothetical protein
MPLKIEPAIKVALFSEFLPGTLIQLADGTPAIAAVTTGRQPPDKVLITYAKVESKFQYNVLDGDPSIIGFMGELILQPDVSSAFESKPNPSSLNELYFEGTTPFVAIHIKGAVPGAGVRPLNLATGVIEPFHSGQMIGFRKWRICVREGGELHELMDFKLSAATIFAKLGQ